MLLSIVVVLSFLDVVVLNSDDNVHSFLNAARKQQDSGINTFSDISSYCNEDVECLLEAGGHLPRHDAVQKIKEESQKNKNMDLHPTQKIRHKPRSSGSKTVEKIKYKQVLSENKDDDDSPKVNKRVLPAEFLKGFENEDLLDMIRLGDDSGPKYSLRELGITNTNQFVRKEEDLIKESWEVLLRASAGDKSINIYELWMSNITINECNPRLRSTNSSFQGVYKSRLVEAWDKIHQVRLSLYNAGDRVFSMTFDAQNTDKTSWFSGRWITSNPYRDLNVEPLDIFSFKGRRTVKRSGVSSRRLYISKNQSTCEEEEAWLIVLDADSDEEFCQFKHAPLFLYSDEKYAVKGKDLKTAEILLIEGKIKYNVNDVQKLKG